MSKYVWQGDDGERLVFEVDDDEEGDEDGEEEAGGDDEQADEKVDDDDGPAEYERVENVFRKERGAIRACTDVAELKRWRQAYESNLAEGTLSRIAQVRARDLIELIAARVMDLKAKRLASRES
jgi:hypothetical protein